VINELQSAAAAAIIAPWRNVHSAMKGRPVDLLDLERAVSELSRLDPKQGRIVELHFSGRFSIEETAEFSGISPATVKRHSSTVRIWLHELHCGEGRA
jgi:DNA-directed RNA polymerase specialized sigma24 family protein